ncbi:hypothetical protein [Streptomyces chartreusis]|uniref:hypothetical protein n=1 Tax=Streptomyces chartreusis TaxID=1969 RepID=UPI0016735DD2|nr:hypothetical protein [Streptomyces chartreusis]GGX57783.1 hypothetical protein GCM10010321_88390 [Streptomyces chartreusis]
MTKVPEVRVVAGHDAAQAGFVGADLAVEEGVPGELDEPGFGLTAGRAGADLRKVLAQISPPQAPSSAAASAQ